MLRRLLLLCITGLVIWIAAIAEAGIGLLREVNALQALQVADQPLDVARAMEHADRAAERAIALRDRASILRYPLKLLTWLPEVGPLLGQAGPLLDVGAELSLAARQAINIARPAAAGMGTAVLPPVVVVARQAAAAPWAATEIRARLTNAEALLATVDRVGLPERVTEALALLTDGLQFAEPAAAALPTLPALVGAVGAPAHYLVILQNTDERRATGGFISAVALVTVQNGQVGALQFRDSYLENTRDEPTLTRILSTYPPAPDAMQDLLYLPVQVFRDSNWEPDVRLSGPVIADRYERATGVRPDGVVLITPEVALSVVDVLQPLVLDDGTAITRQNLLDLLRDSFARPRDVDLEVWYRNRKEIYNRLAATLLTRLTTGVPDPRLLPTAIRLLEEKQVLLYARDPALQAALESRGWAGAMSPPAGDYLMVVESNVGFSKANALVDTSLAYEVDLRPRFYTAKLTVTFTHRGVANIPVNEQCVQYTGYAFFENLTYEAVSDRCYYAHLRAYVPYISDVINGNLADIPGVAMDDGQRRSGALRTERRDPYTMFSWPALSRPATISAQEITYFLPTNIVQDNFYRLDVQKQPGTGATPLRVTIHLPPSAKLVESPTPPTLENNTIIIDTDLRRDRRIVVNLAAAR